MNQRVLTTSLGIAALAVALTVVLLAQTPAAAQAQKAAPTSAAAKPGCG